MNLAIGQDTPPLSSLYFKEGLKLQLMLSPILSHLRATNTAMENTRCFHSVQGKRVSKDTTLSSGPNDFFLHLIRFRQLLTELRNVLNSLPQVSIPNTVQGRKQ